MSVFTPRRQRQQLIFFLIRVVGGGVRMGPLGTTAMIGLLYLPRVFMRMEDLVEWWLARETEVLGENLSHCHFIHHESHITWPGVNSGRCSGKPATKRLSYGKADSVSTWVV
jgi:hypothetical protein